MPPRGLALCLERVSGTEQGGVCTRPCIGPIEHAAKSARARERPLRLELSDIDRDMFHKRQAEAVRACLSKWIPAEIKTWQDQQVMSLGPSCPPLEINPM